MCIRDSKRGAWELWPPGVSTLGGSTWLYLYQWPETHLAQPGALPLPHTTCREKQRKEWIHTPSDVGPNPFISTKEVQSNPYNPSGRGDGPIHFTQVVHHIQPRQPTRDAPIGSRTPSLLPTTGRQTKKGVVSLSHLFSDPGPYRAQLESSAEDPYCGQTEH